MADPATPELKEFRCNACGRYFGTAEELSAHEVHCRAAKETTAHGRAELAAQDAEPHLPNDMEPEARGVKHAGEGPLRRANR